MFIASVFLKNLKIYSNNVKKQPQKGDCVEIRQGRGGRGFTKGRECGILTLIIYFYTQGGYSDDPVL